MKQSEARASLIKDAPRAINWKAVALQLVRANPNLNRARFKEAITRVSKTVASLLTTRRQAQHVSQKPADTDVMQKAKQKLMRAYEKEYQRQLKTLRGLI